MPVLDAQNLVKSLGTRSLLQSVNVTIARGEKVGIVGDNGAGKSTLAKILAGEMDADGGEVIRRRDSTVAYLQQDPTFPPNTKAVDAALLSLGEWQLYQDKYEKLCAELASGISEDSPQWARILSEQEEATKNIERLGGWNRKDDAARILKTLGIHNLDQLVDTMSGGEKRRVALAGLLIQSPDLAILDEPTNHLDAETIEWLEEYLSESFPGAILLITHDRLLLNRVVNRTLEVTRGQVYSYNGGWEDYLLAREERLSQEARTEANRQNFLRKEIEWLRRQPKARGTKQKARISRAENAIAATPEAQARALSLTFSEERLGGTILEARKLEVGIAGRSLIAPFDLHVTKGSRIGIVGRSGAGKTTLLRTLLEEIPALSGEVITGKNTKIAYLDQTRAGLDDEETVFDAVTGGRPSVKVGEHEYSSYSYLERFSFKGDTLRQQVGGLSGGERARIGLARLLLTTANVLVLDEPTNDLDVMTLAALEELLLDVQGATLIVSHDRYFLDRIATSTLAIDGEGELHHIQGGYSNYAEWRAIWERSRKAQNKEKEKASASDNTQSASPTKAKAAASPAKKKLTYAEELELKGLMEKVEAATAQVAELESQLADPSLHVERREEAVRLQKELQAAQEKLEELEMRWLELEEKRS